MEIKNSYVLVASCTRKGHFRQLTSPAADEIDKNARREAAACRNAGRAGRILMDAADICLETGYLLRASHLYYDALLLMADYSLEHRTLRLAHEMSRAGRGLENVKRRVGGTTSYTEEMRVRDLLKNVTALYQEVDLNMEDITVDADVDFSNVAVFFEAGHRRYIEKCNNA